MRATTILKRAAYLALLAAGYAYGFLQLPESGPGLPLADKVSAVLPWLGQAWPALFLMTSTTALATWFVAMLVAERRAQRSRRELAKTADPALFQQTDGEKAISYLLNESAWGWREFRKLNFWHVISPAEYEEFRRVAMTTNLRVVGLDEDRNSVLIGRGYWQDAQLYPMLGTSFGLSTTPRRYARQSITRYTHLSVATDDLHDAWPRASLQQRLLARAWVCKKLTFGIALPSLLDKVPVVGKYLASPLHKLFDDPKRKMASQPPPHQAELSSRPSSEEIESALVEFAQQGFGIRETFMRDNDPLRIKTDRQAWALSIERYLSQNLGKSYALQFKAASGRGLVPVGRSAEGGHLWTDIGAKIDAVNKIIEEIRSRKK